MALAWVLRDGVATSVLIGASKPEQILQNLKALESAPFTQEELDAIDRTVGRCWEVIDADAAKILPLEGKPNTPAEIRTP